jgi:uncharacterized membrane protein YuzA (DUF378 family)
VLLHAANPFDVVRRVETEPSGGAGRLEQAVAPLPRSQELRRDAGPKKLDLLAATLLIVGGLNWGLVAVAKFDLVAWIFGLDFGQTNAASRIVYGLVGLAAIYGIVALVSRVRGTSPEPIAAR